MILELILLRVINLLFLARNANNQKFVMKDEFSVDTFEAFLKDIEAGTLEPYLNSACP